MFTWICPKCGSDVSPSYSECPNCASEAAKMQSVLKDSPATAVEQPSAPIPSAVPAYTPPPASVTTAATYAPEPPIPVAYAPAPPAASPVAYAPAPPTPERKQLPAALITLLTMAGIAALLFVIYTVVNKYKDEPIDAGETGPPATTASSSAATVNPLGKHLEISGIRLSREGNRAKIQFVLVNHSAAELPELRLNLQLAAGGRPIFEFPFTAPSMGPYESRDLSTTVKTSLKAYEWPDWQALRPQFRVLD